MFSTLKKYTGLITVEERDDLIYIEGINTYAMENGIRNLFSTSKVAKHMFHEIGSSHLVISKFFLLDFVFVAKLLLEEGRVQIAHRTLHRMLDELYENTWIKDTLIDHPGILDMSVTKLFYKTPLEPQMEFFQKYNTAVPKYHLKGYMLAGAPGSGKTYMGLWLSEALHSDHVIVVCPNNAVHRVWEDSILNEYRKPPSYWIASSNKPYVGQKYLVGHYEALPKLLEAAKKVGGKVTVLLDECHNLNEPTSLRTQLFIQLCKQVNSQNIVWASGTPIKALGSESIAFLTTIDPYFDAESAARFKKIFGAEAKRAIEIIRHRLDLVSHKIEKKELKLTDPIIETVKVKTPNAKQFTLSAIAKDMEAFIAERAQYYKTREADDKAFFYECLEYIEHRLSGQKELQEYRQYLRSLNMIINTPPRNLYLIPEELAYCKQYEKRQIIPNLPYDWGKKFKDVASVVKYVSLKIQGECLGRILGKKRIEATLELAQYVDYAKYIESTEAKTLVFTSYVDVLERTQAHIREKGYQPITVYGKNSGQLSGIVENFQNDEDLNPLVTTFATLSTAVPMTMANVIVMLNSPFRDYILQQTISRVHRLGQTRQVYIYICSLDTGDEPNISTRSVDILKWSQSQIEDIMGIKSPYELDDAEISVESVRDELAIRRTCSKQEQVSVAFLSW